MGVRLDSFYSTNAYSGLMKVSFDGCASNVPSSCSSSSTLPYTASASVCYSSSRCVANLDIEYSTTGAESSYVSAKTHTLSNSNAADSNPEQTVSIPSSVPAAKYWRIKLLTFHSTNCHAGLMKVEVKGC